MFDPDPKSPSKNSRGAHPAPGILRAGGRLAALLTLLSAGCSSYPTILPDASAAGHDFVLIEEWRGEIRKITLWFEPDHLLEWELVRTENDERNKIPLAVLDYGEVPPVMDQVFPKDRPDPLREGQVIQVALEYSPEGDPYAVIRNAVTRWYRKEAGHFKEVSEMEESLPKKGGEKERQERPGPR